MRCAMPWYKMALSGDSQYSCCMAEAGFTASYHEFDGVSPREVSLWGIWNSEIFRTMRREMIEGGPRIACGKPDEIGDKPDCFYMLGVSEANLEGLTSDQIENIRLAKKGFEAGELELKSYPIELEFVLDLSCNLRCVMCSQLPNRRAGKINMLRIENFGGELADFLHHARDVVVLGGEPTISPRYDDMVSVVRASAGGKILLVTNGHLIKRCVLPNMDVMGKFHLSVDAATEATYNKIRRGGSWPNLIENLEALKEAKGSRHALIHNVISPLNYEEMPDMVTFASDMGMDLVRFDEVRPFGSLTEENMRGLTFEPKDPELNAKLEEAMEAAEREGIHMAYTLPAIGKTGYVSPQRTWCNAS